MNTRTLIKHQHNNRSILSYHESDELCDNETDLQLRGNVSIDLESLE